jgi:hypothetical protein
LTGAGTTLGFAVQHDSPIVLKTVGMSGDSAPARGRGWSITGRQLELKEAAGQVLARFDGRHME